MSPPPWYGGMAFSSSALAVEHPDARRPDQFVPGERVEIGVQRLHVHLHVRRGLRPIDQRERAGWCAISMISARPG